MHASSRISAGLPVPPSGQAVALVHRGGLAKPSAPARHGKYIARRPEQPPTDRFMNRGHGERSSSASRTQPDRKDTHPSPASQPVQTRESAGMQSIAR